MKYFKKGAEPQELIDWKNQQTEDWIPTFDDLRGAEKEFVYDALKKEQGYICCYCERELRDNDYHIEHLKPKDRNKFPELQLVYSNLLCSCQRNIKNGNPSHCGNSKGNWYNEDKFISPLYIDCETRFKYTGDGQILPSDEKDEAAKTTIQKLKLDIDKLNNLRKDAIEPFLDENLSQADLNSFVQGYFS